MELPLNPNQPKIIDRNGTERFKSNKIVEFLLDQYNNNMNSLAMMNFTDDDRSQFAQLIGYSVCGYHDLPYSKKDDPEC
jgi:hypothetical protein